MDAEKTAADAHQKAAEQVERAKSLVGQALGQIEEISRGLKNETHDGKACLPMTGGARTKLRRLRLIAVQLTGSPIDLHQCFRC